MVEVDQHVARRTNDAIAARMCLDLAGLERLDDLDLASRLKLALRGGDNVDAAEIGPDERSDDKRADDPEERNPDRRRRRLQDLQRRRQKFAVADQAPVLPSVCASAS